MKISVKERGLSGLLFIGLALIISVIITIYIMTTWYANALYHIVDIKQPIINNFAIIGTFGALIGFVATKHNKKSQRLDFIVIFIIQCLFSSYAIYQLWLTRPAYIVYDTIDFFIIKQNELMPPNTKPAVPWSYFSPTYVGITPAINDEEKSQRILRQYNSGVFNAQNTELYTPFDERYTAVLDKILKYNNTKNQDTTNSCIDKTTNADLSFFVASSLNNHEKGVYFVGLKKQTNQYQIMQLFYCAKPTT